MSTGNNKEYESAKSAYEDAIAKYTGTDAYRANNDPYVQQSSMNATQRGYNLGNKYGSELLNNSVAQGDTIGNVQTNRALQRATTAGKSLTNSALSQGLANEMRVGNQALAEGTSRGNAVAKNAYEQGKTRAADANNTALNQGLNAANTINSRGKVHSWRREEPRAPPLPHLHLRGSSP